MTNKNSIMFDDDFENDDIEEDLETEEMQETQHMVDVMKFAIETCEAVINNLKDVKASLDVLKGPVISESDATYVDFLEEKMRNTIRMILGEGKEEWIKISKLDSESASILYDNNRKQILEFFSDLFDKGNN